MACCFLASRCHKQKPQCVMNRNSKIKCSSLLFKPQRLLLLGCFGFGLARGDQFTAKPAKAYTDVGCYPTAVAEDPKSVVDQRFGKTLHTALGDNNFHSLIITFSQCYGGGCIDEVAKAFAASTKPISMTSASKWNEDSICQLATPGAAKDDGYSRWSQAYFLVHPGVASGNNLNGSESAAYDNAFATSAWQIGLLGKNKRTSQFKTL